MGLGENIYKLRTERSLSQDDLANALEVSRQSVSKWETGGSVPELDKLIKLSAFFGISLDALVTDATKDAPAAEPQVICKEPVSGSSAKKILGIVLLCFGGLLLVMLTLLGDILAGLILAAPFAACGLICLLIHKHTGLWCCWVIYLFVDIYLRFATGVTWAFVLYPQVYTGGWTIHLIVAWSLLAAFAALTISTAICLRDALPKRLSFHIIGSISAWAVYFLTWFFFALPAYSAETDFIHSSAYRFVTALSDWIRSIIVAVAIILTIRLAALLFKKATRRP